jgi:hypothetical protein
MNYEGTETKDYESETPQKESARERKKHKVRHEREETPKIKQVTESGHKGR